MSIEDSELLAEFAVESKEHLENIEQEILEIEEGGKNIDVDLVNKVFRGVHSIKGAAGFLGLNVIKTLAHSLENLLNLIRSEELVPTAGIADVMLRSGDMLRNLLNDIANSNSVDVSDLVSELEAAVSGEESSVESHNSTDKAAAASSIAEVGGVVDNAPSTEQELQSTSTEPITETLAEPPKTAPKEANNTKPQSSASRPTAAESSIRVSVGVLDQLMNLAGELVLNRNHLLQALASNERQGLEAASTELDQVTSNLQEAIMQTRMQPIGNVFGKFPRVVRDLSSKLGKECKLEVEGKEVEVDKTIIEAIGDPLTHLIRNSVDHGVEMPADRISNGKEASGTIWLRAFHKAGKVCVEIQDNGAGIDPGRIKAKAVEKGVISAERAEQMCDREAVRLIFHPGFSTAEKLSDVSGRGVGMDVVRTNIERLGGNVDVESEVGVGTNIRVALPLTLAIIPSMILECSGERYAVPQASVAELVRLRAEETAERIGSVKSAEVLRLRGKLLPLVNLTESLGLEQEQSDSDQTGPLNIVVVETGQLSYGLVVDRIHDSEEIVVKPLGRHLKNCKTMAGATILGDGRIALILDAAGIASQTGVQVKHDSDPQEESAQVEQRSNADGHTLLLFSTDPRDQFAVPMEVVSRIERVRADQIDSIAGSKLLQFRGVSLPLISVEEHLDVLSPPENSRVYVIVFTVGEREVGLIAPRLDDIRDVESSIDTETFRVPGVAGSLLVDGRETRLLDVFELAKASHPQWFQNQQPPKEEVDRPTRILLAEDSSFFRRQVAGFLVSEGYELVEFEDGQAAWDALKEEGLQVDMVVTDIEMPRMDGFELCRKIKTDSELERLPVIALTSLSGDDHQQRGKDVGFDDYQVKMHRDKLIRAVQSLTSQPKASAFAASPSTSTTFWS